MDREEVERSGEILHNKISIDVAKLLNGVYFISVKTNADFAVQKIAIVR